MKKVEEFCLEMKDPLPFSLAGVGDEEITSTTEVESNESERRTQSKGSDPPSYDDAMNNSSFQEQVDNELAQELQEKLNSD